MVIPAFVQSPSGAAALRSFRHRGKPVWAALSREGQAEAVQHGEDTSETVAWTD